MPSSPRAFSVCSVDCSPRSAPRGCPSPRRCERREATTLACGNPPLMKAKEIVRRLREEGWQFKAQKGSHAQYIHPLKPGKVTVPMHAGKDVTKDVLR